MQVIGNMFNFRPATSGELLFQHVADQFISKEAIQQVYQWSYLQIGNRQDDLVEYYIGIFCFNLTARLIKKAKHLAEDFAVIESQRPNQMKAYVQTEMGIAIDSKNKHDISKLISLSISAALESGKSIAPSTKKLVTSGQGAICCYICGVGLQLAGDDEFTQIQYEHIWPSSFGGDSILENLLPACGKCNNAKNSMLLWQDAYVHSFVLEPFPSVGAIKSISRREKIALHRRKIFREACEKRRTLKDAALIVGSMDMDVLTQMYPHDAVDFFNCTV
ncbi:MAG: HNH endonuclease [Sideroxyarcus sp.]|nr:HNH endonuclease [Sideroxyarcus sp.]